MQLIEFLRFRQVNRRSPIVSDDDKVFHRTARMARQASDNLIRACFQFLQPALNLTQYFRFLQVLMPYRAGSFDRIARPTRGF